MSDVNKVDVMSKGAAKRAGTTFVYIKTRSTSSCTHAHKLRCISHDLSRITTVI